MNGKILIVDDEPGQQQLLRYNVEKSGFDVLLADNGNDALNIVDEVKPDLIVLDWMIPEASGIDVCYELRSRPETRYLPILMVSARGEDIDLAMALDAGADDYITKPFSPRELIARIKSLLRRSRPTLLQDKLEFGDLELNPETMRVKRDGDDIHLGAREFKLLSLLIERPERVFSRDQLLDLIWGHGVYVEDRTVDVHMSRLRSALNKRSDGGPDRPDIIRTVRGAGYALTKNFK